MTLPLGRWTRRRILALWGAGMLLEAALLGVMSALLVRPDPPLVERLRGERAREIQSVFVYSAPADTSAWPPTVAADPVEEEDSFYTILHWPLDRPLLDGGGRVVAVPMRLWWVPALYVLGVPLLLVALSGAWLWARRRAPGSPPA